MQLGHYLSTITYSWTVFLSLSIYLFIDIFNRKIVGWQAYEEESSALAGELLRDLCRREGIQSNKLILHFDNGSPM